MKKITLFMAAMLLIAANTVLAQTSTTDAGVVINGVKWATRNVATHGTFVDKPEDYGALFQWGRKGDGHEQRTSPNYPTNNINWEAGVISGAANFDANGQIVSTHAAYGKFIKQDAEPYDWRSPQNDALWNAGTEAAPIKTANDPCPTGWRVPTTTELRSLEATGSEWSTENEVNGRVFGNGDSFIFLPAAGSRSVNGIFYDSHSNGYYCSSSIYLNGTRSCNMFFGSGGAHPVYDSGRANGNSVRCVADGSAMSIGSVEDTQSAPNIIGYYSITGQQLPQEPQSGVYIVKYDNGKAEKRIKK